MGFYSSPFSSARKIASELRGSGKISDRVALLIKRIEIENKKLNALVHVDAKGALHRAAALEAKPIAERGRLYGVTFSAKANIDVAGMPSSDGSAGSVSTAKINDRLVDMLLAEDAICLGKGNMAEGGKSSAFTDNSIYGRTVNPINHQFSPGGSTGGDAAAVAAGLVDFGIGGDSGGSLRVPANYCGLYGILPTRGLVTGSHSRFIGSVLTKHFGSAGMITRSCDDLALLFEILIGFNPEMSRSIPAPPFFTLNSAKSKQFAVITRLAGTDCDTEISSEINKIAQSLNASGYLAVDGTLAEFEESFEPYIVLAGQAALLEEDVVAAQSGITRDEALEGQILKQLRAKIASALPPLTAERLLLCMHKVEDLRNRVSKIFNEYEFILMPVAACSAPRLGQELFEVNGQKIESHIAYHFSRSVNLLGLPAIAFPTGTTKNGLPLGVQIVGPRFSERRLMEIVSNLSL